jgi:hypothetical protein
LGTQSPNALLHCYSTGNGEIEVERASGALINLQAQAARGVIGTDSNHELQLKTNASARMTISNTGATTFSGAVTVGVDDTGHDVKFFGATSGSYMLWDESTDDLILGGASRLGIGTTTPTANLDITSSLNQQHLYIQGALDSGNTALARLKTISSGNVLLLESATTSDSREIFDVKNSNGTVFKIQGDGMSVFSKGLTTSITTVNNTDYTLATTDHIIIFTNLSAGRTLTLQTAQAVAGRMVIVKEKDGYASSYNITIATEGSETIDGNNTATLSTDKGTIRLTSDGTNWLII